MIADGQSSIDSLSIQVDGYDPLVNWDEYRYSDRYDSPYPQWSFSTAPQTVDGEKAVPVQLRVGAKVTVRVNGLPLCVGYIDERQIDSDSGGGVRIKITGRDILGPVDDACMDPQTRWSSGLSIADCLLAVLTPHGITRIVNGDELDLSVMTGKPKTAQSKSKALLAQVPTADGLFTTSSGTYTAITGRKDLTTIKQDQVKPKIGEGVKDFISRIAKRYGFTLRATADGSGIMATVPKFDQTPLYRLYHTSQTSNVTKASITDRIYNQPSVVVGFCGSSKATGVQRTTAIAINELVAYKPNGSYTDHTQAVLDRYAHAARSKERQQLKIIGVKNKAVTRPTPVFFESQESKNTEQLLAACRRELARLQSQALECKYSVIGFSQGGIPWTINTIVDVHDEISGIYGPMWIKERTFSKSSGGGTTTDLVLIRPYTMEY